MNNDTSDYSLLHGQPKLHEFIDNPYTLSLLSYA